MTATVWPVVACGPRENATCLHCRRPIKPGERMVDERDTLGGWLCLWCSDNT